MDLLKSTIMASMTALRHYYSQQCAFRDHYKDTNELAKMESASNFVKTTNAAYEDINLKMNLSVSPPIFIDCIYVYWKTMLSNSADSN